MWQVQRREWKHGLQAKIDAQLAEPPVAVADAAVARALASTEFVPVRLDGAVAGDEAVALGHARAIAPVVLKDGSRVLAMGHKGQFASGSASSIVGFTRVRPCRPPAVGPADPG